MFKEIPKGKLQKSINWCIFENCIWNLFDSFDLVLFGSQRLGILFFLPENHMPVRIQPYQDKKHDRES